MGYSCALFTPKIVWMEIIFKLFFSLQSGTLKTKGCNSSDDSLIACAWHKDGKKFVAGGSRGQFYQIVC